MRPVNQGVSLMPRDDHVHAGQRRDRDHFDVLHAELARVEHELGGDGFEPGLVVIDAVHLVDREDHVLHA